MIQPISGPMRGLDCESRTACLLTSSSAFCGDGLVEVGEQCDCGSDWACLLSRACCYPPSNSQPGGCQLRSEKARDDAHASSLMP